MKVTLSFDQLRSLNEIINYRPPSVIAFFNASFDTMQAELLSVLTTPPEKKGEEIVFLKKRTAMDGSPAFEFKSKLYGKSFITSESVNDLIRKDIISLAKTARRKNIIKVHENKFERWLIDKHNIFLDELIQGNNLETKNLSGGMVEVSGDSLGTFKKYYNEFMGIRESIRPYRRIFQEKIPLSKVRPFLKGHGDKYKERLSKWFNGKWRQVIPLQKGVKMGVEIKSDVEKEIEYKLSNTQFELRDFVKGIAWDKKNNREVKLGKVLNKIGDKDLLQRFNNADGRQTKNENNLMMVVSRHPYDILGQSFDRGWISCKELGKGINEKYLKDEIFQILIAYLVYPDDKNINRPIARILAVPFFNSSLEIGYILQPNTYGSSGSWESSFRSEFQKWLDTKQGKLKGHYKISPFVYNDGLHNGITLYDRESVPEYVLKSGNMPDKFEYVEQRGEQYFRWLSGEWKDSIWYEEPLLNNDPIRFVWVDGIFRNGTWQDGTWHDGTWQRGDWYGGHWKGGIWQDGTWHDGYWEFGEWHGWNWIIGWIYDPDREGAFEPDWEWEEDYVRSPLNPKEYFSSVKPYEVKDAW